MPRIACLQTRPRATYEEAIAELRPLAEQAVHGGAQLLCLPEYCGGLVSDGPLFRPPATIEGQHPVLEFLQKFAAESGIWILVGSIAITAENGLILNRTYVLDSAGDIVARYDKIHLFDIQLSSSVRFQESAVVSPGNRAVVVSTPFGRVGLSICYDLRFPQLYRGLAQEGADILAVPAAFTRVTGQAHWHVLNRCRAIENGAYVVAPGAIGNVPGGGECFGHSLIVDPWGVVLADGG
ncbi:MAG: carbon-nitrogen hydrolase family protein, partial [Rhodobacteraceae bacterium]|nr:carbon-nitrogen hydrolase family protein [Paracoccaceae bacterium]